MSERLNQYQRRQADRQMNSIVARCMGQAIVLTALGFGVYYLLIRDSLNRAMYQTVLDSGGRVTLGQIAAARFWDYVLPALAVWFCLWMTLGIIATFRAERRHSDFAFTDQEMNVQNVRNRTMIRPRNLAKISPREFEEEIARLITARTGCHTQVVGGSGDRGVDVKVYDRTHRLVGVVQCKRYRPNKALPPMFVREMVAVRQMHQVNIAYLATTAYFTTASRREAAQLGVRLIDGHDLKHISRKAASLPAQQTQALQPYSNVVDRDDPNTRFRSPQRPMNEQERIQQQLSERRQRLQQRH